MSNSTTPSGGLNAVPLESPPPYEPKPDDVEAEPSVESHRPPATRALTWKKLLLSVALALLSFWFTFLVLHAFTAPRPKVLYASSYSKEHRFRPAASPIITEILADGRTRIRGADPTHRD